RQNLESLSVSDRRPRIGKFDRTRFRVDQIFFGRDLCECNGKFGRTVRIRGPTAFEKFNRGFVFRIFQKRSNDGCKLEKFVLCRAVTILEYGRKKLLTAFYQCVCGSFVLQLSERTKRRNADTAVGIFERGNKQKVKRI